MEKLIKLGNNRKPMLDDKGNVITESFTNEMANSLLSQKYPYWARSKDAEKAPMEAREKEVITSKNPETK